MIVKPTLQVDKLFFPTVTTISSFKSGQLCSWGRVRVVTEVLILFYFLTWVVLTQIYSAQNLRVIHLKFVIFIYISYNSIEMSINFKNFLVEVFLLLICQLLITLQLFTYHCGLVHIYFSNHSLLWPLSCSIPSISSWTLRKQQCKKTQMYKMDTRST